MVRVSLQIRVERLYRVARPYRLPHRLRKTQIREQPPHLHDLSDQAGIRDSPFLGEFVELRLGSCLRFLGVDLAEIAADTGSILDPDGLRDVSLHMDEASLMNGAWKGGGDCFRHPLEAVRDEDLRVSDAPFLELKKEVFPGMRAFVRDGGEIQYLLMAGGGDPHDDLDAFVGDAPAHPRVFPLKRNVGAVHEDDHAFGKPALFEFERGGKYLPDGSAYGLAGHRQADRLVEVIDYLVLGHALEVKRLDDEFDVLAGLLVRFDDLGLEVIEPVPWDLHLDRAELRLQMALVIAVPDVEGLISERVGQEILDLAVHEVVYRLLDLLFDEVVQSRDEHIAQVLGPLLLD